MLQRIVECVEEGEELFMNDWDYITTLQSLHLLIEKFNLDEFMEEYTFTKEEYEKYFKDITKSYDMSLHKEIKRRFKKKLKRDEKQQSESTVTNILEIDNGYTDRDMIFESIIDGEFYETYYMKMKIVNMLQLFFDKYGLESFMISDISYKDYKKYFRDNIKENNPQWDERVMRNLKNKGERL